MLNNCYRHLGYRPPPHSYGMFPLILIGGGILDVVQRRFQNDQPPSSPPNPPQRFSSQLPPQTASLLDRISEYCHPPVGPAVGPPFG